MNGMPYTQHMNDRASEGDWAPQVAVVFEGERASFGKDQNVLGILTVESYFSCCCLTL